MPLLFRFVYKPAAFAKSFALFLVLAILGPMAAAEGLCPADSRYETYQSALDAAKKLYTQKVKTCGEAVVEVEETYQGLSDSQQSWLGEIKIKTQCEAKPEESFKFKIVNETDGCTLKNGNHVEEFSYFIIDGDQISIADKSKQKSDIN